MALSEKFDEVAPGDEAPWYDVMIDGGEVKDYDPAGNVISGHLENLRARFTRRLPKISLVGRGFLT